MASKMTSEPGNGPTCTVCFETTDVLKGVPTCKHHCCEECLSKHIKTTSAASESFPCPICQVECPLVDNGVGDLEDHHQADECREEPTATESVVCLTCRFTNDITVKATSMCPECENMYLCEGCTQVHGRNQSTVNHVVISLESTKKKEATCRIHKEKIGSYCCTCQKPCCRLCAFFEHGDHDVKKIWEAFRRVLQDAQRVSEEYEKRSSHMKSIEKQMIFLKHSDISRRRDVLIREIEDHSETCIQKIIKQKEELKENVQQDYKVVSEVYDWLEKIPELDKLDNAIAKSKTLLPKAEPQQSDILKLSSIKRQIVDSGLPEIIDVDKYMESFTRLFRNPTKFVPNLSAHSLGELAVSETRTNKSITECKLVFEKKLPVDDEAKYIPCVANLGNDFYAIAHPTVPGTPSNAIDIYRLPGDFQRTITDHINHVYDMAATPDRQLAVLSDGQTQDLCSVRLFDPATGQMKSTTDVPVRDPISFDVNLRHQYVILSKDGIWARSVTEVNEDGSVECSREVDQSLIRDASRVACCEGEDILLGRAMMCDAMDCKQLYSNSNRQHKDISASLFGEITACYKSSDNIKFLRGSILNGKLQKEVYTTISTTDRGIRAEARLSVGGGYIVSSQDMTIRVFKDD